MTAKGARQTFYVLMLSHGDIFQGCLRFGSIVEGLNPGLILWVKLNGKASSRNDHEVCLSNILFSNAERRGYFPAISEVWLYGRGLEPWAGLGG